MAGDQTVGRRPTQLGANTAATSDSFEPEERLPARVKWLFGLGNLTTSAPLAIVSFFQLFFLTDVARLTPALAAWPILLGKVWDAFNDPLVGILADRIKSRYGRRRILLIVGAAPVGLSYMLMWLVPPLGTAGLVIYYTLVYILFDTCYTVIQVAFDSLTPSLSTDYDEQSSVNGIRMVYSIGGSLLAIIIGTVLQWIFDDLGTVFSIIGFVLGALIIIPPLVVTRVTKGRDRESGGEQPPTLEGIRYVLRNRPFWLVMGIFLTSWTAVSIVAADLVYYARYNLAVPDQASYFVLVAQGLALGFIPVIVLIARKRDKRRAVFWGFGSMVPPLLLVALIPSSHYYLVYGLAALMGLGIATAYVTPWSMMPDVIQWDLKRTGVHREASYYAIISFFQKLGTAAALWIMAQVLEITGYVTPDAANPIPVQPTEALSAIRIFITIVPSGLLLTAMAFAVGYPISRSVHRELRAELEQQGL